jgi:hypothetical protein
MEGSEGAGNNTVVLVVNIQDKIWKGEEAAGLVG